MALEIKTLDDKNVWEVFVIKHSPQSLFQSWNWGEVVKKVQSSKLKAQNNFSRIGLYENQSLIGIAQIETVYAKKGRFLHIRHGPILNEYKEQYLKKLLSFLTLKAKETGSSYLRISPLIDNSDSNCQLFKSLGFRDSPLHALDGEYVWVLDINKSEEELLGSMRKTTRYLIRKAQKMGVIVEKSNNIDQFLNLYTTTSRRHGFLEHIGVREEYEIYAKEDEVVLFMATYEKKVMAAALILFGGNQAIYHHGASISSDIPASYLLQWEAIKKAKKRGLRYYNFWGIAPEGKPHHPWRGLTLFKTGFGGTAKEYLHAQDYIFSPFYYLTYILETLRKLKRGY